jgi:hypothetical protein
MVARVVAIGIPTETVSPRCRVDLRATVSAALDYGLGCIEHGEDMPCARLKR